jgi:hypothetical protein
MMLGPHDRVTLALRQSGFTSTMGFSDRPHTWQFTSKSPATFVTAAARLPSVSPEAAPTGGPARAVHANIEPLVHAGPRDAEEELPVLALLSVHEVPSQV